MKIRKKSLVGARLYNQKNRKSINHLFCLTEPRKNSISPWEAYSLEKSE